MVSVDGVLSRMTLSKTPDRRQLKWEVAPSACLPHLGISACSGCDLLEGCPLQGICIFASTRHPHHTMLFWDQHRLMKRSKLKIPAPVCQPCRVVLKSRCN